MLKTSLLKNLRLLALALGALLQLTTLQADGPHPKKQHAVMDELQDKIATLQLATDQLKEVARDVKDPKVRSRIKDVLRLSHQMVKQGKKADAEKVKLVLSSVEKAIGYLTQKKTIQHLPSSSSSSESCSVCSELSDLEEDVTKCCIDIKTIITEIIEFLEAEFPCGAPIPITEVPTIIDAPGKYCVTTDLNHFGQGAAITVHASNVTINFHTHSLTLHNSNAIGILVENVNEFVCENDVIQGIATDTAIQLSNVHKATLRNLYTQGTDVGVLLNNLTSDVLIENCLFRGHADAGVENYDANTLTIDNCTFDGQDAGGIGVEITSGVVILPPGPQNIKILGSTFTGWRQSVAAIRVTGLLIDDCLAIGSGTQFKNLIQLGDNTHEGNDVIIRNSTFSQPVDIADADGLLLQNGTGCLLENIVVDTANSSTVGLYLPAAIHVGLTAGTSTFFYKNVLARSCIVTGANSFGLLLDAASQVTFYDSKFTDGLTTNITINEKSTQNVIKDSTIYNSGGNGVQIEGGAKDNAIINCVISNNMDDGINTFQATGLLHLRGNKVFGNGAVGINILNGTATQAYFNTSCENVSFDCSGILPATLMQAPGAPSVVAGSNICCIQP